MRIDNAGNVGIGTSSPNNLLTVYSSSSGSYVDIKGAGDAYNFSGFKLDSDEATDKSWAFYHRKISGEINNFAIEHFNGTNYVQNLVIQPGGNVGIGTTSPTYKLHVNGSVAGTSAYNNISDSIFKTNVEPIKNAMNKIMALRPLSYDWKHEEYPEMNFEKGKGMGFLAQEIELIIPEMVLKSNKGIYSLQYSELIPVLVKALQEQQQVIEDLKTENGTLKSEVENEKATNNSQKSEIEEINAKLELIQQMLNEGRTEK